MKPYRIPLDILHKFTLTEDYYDHRDKRAFKQPSLISLLDEAGLTYFYESFTALNLISGSSDKERFKDALDAADKEHALYFIFNSVPDAAGHKYGGNSKSTQNALRQMDADLERFVNEFESKRPGTRYFFVGDHGMIDVEETINVEDIILNQAKKNKLKLGKDYTYFLDSTLCRIWFHSLKAKNQFADEIANNQDLLKAGVFIDEELAQNNNIPFGDYRYGDLLWSANAGIMILPDFFHRKDESVIGMHGYDINHINSKGMCIIFGDGQENKTTPELPLTEVHSLLKKSLREQTDTLLK